MDEQTLALFLEKFAEAAHRDLNAALLRSKVIKLCYAHRSRIKSHDKLLEKIVRKRTKKPDYGLFNITDLIGLRLVTLFRKDLSEVVLSALNLIAGRDVSPVPFTAAPPEEIIIYSVHHELDTLVRLTIEEHHPAWLERVRVCKSDEDYSSIHIVARLPWEDGKVPPPQIAEAEIPHLPGMPYLIPVEIQIRTVFEDAWGEIDHKYGYALREGKSSGMSFSNTEYVAHHLKILKKFLDACGQYADEIHREATAGNAEDPVGQIIPVEADQELLNCLKELGADPEFIADYEEGRRLKDRALESEAASVSERRAQLLKAAEFFRELADTILDRCGLPASVGNRAENGDLLLFYYVRMNQAFCLMSTNVRADLLIARDVYSELEADFPRFPLLKMRLGQVLGKLSLPDESIAKYHEARKLANATPASQNCRDNPLPLVDRKHLSSMLPVLLGYQYWRKAEETDRRAPDQHAERARYLRLAYEETYTCLVLPDLDPTTEMRAQNNLLYYAVSYLRNGVGESDDFAAQVNKSLPVHMSFLEQKRPHSECTDLEILDTLLFANLQIGVVDVANDIAQRIVNIGLSGPRSALDDSVRLKLIENAYAQLKSGG